MEVVYNREIQQHNNYLPDKQWVYRHANGNRYLRSLFAIDVYEALFGFDDAMSSY
jgi:hypothetical protein